MTGDPAHETDPVRKRIIAAMQRLTAGQPLRSTGRMSVSQLAVEADLPRWHLTHQHVDLKELFQAQVKAAQSTPAAFARDLSDLEKLKGQHAKLVASYAELEAQVAFYAAVINTLALEKDAAQHKAPLTDLEARRQRAPRPADDPG